MQDRPTKRELLVMTSSILLITIAVALKEAPQLKGTPQFGYYLAGKAAMIFCLALSIVSGLLEVNFVYIGFPYILFALMLFYTVHGQLLQPNYWLAYMEFVMIFPFTFNINRKILALLLTIGVIVFNIAFYTSVDLFIRRGSYSRDVYSDIVTGTVISTIMSFICSGLLMAEKSKRVNLYQRFIDLGKNMSSIAHDIKGMISGPCTYIDMLSEPVALAKYSAKEIQLISYLKEDIHSIRDFVLEMNNLVSSHITNHDSLVSISSVIKSIKKVFKSKIKDIRIDQIGDLTLLIKVDYINRILINAIVNSCEAIHNNSKTNGKITIYCEDNLLGVADNSGEQLDVKILKVLNGSHLTFSTKKEGSGLGTLIVRDYVHIVGGKMKYANHIEGVSLEIRFPKKIVIKSILERTA